MADHDVIGTISRSLIRVRKAGQILCTSVGSANPAVGLNADSDVDRGYSDRAADVTESVVVFRMLCTGLCILRRYCRSTRVDTAIIVRLVISILVSKLYASQALAFGQTFDRHLLVQIRRQLQRAAIILLAYAGRSNSNLLLIEDGELESLRTILPSWDVSLFYRTKRGSS